MEFGFRSRYWTYSDEGKKLLSQFKIKISEKWFQEANISY